MTLSRGQPKLPGRSPGVQGRTRLLRCSMARAAPRRPQARSAAAEPDPDSSSQGSTSTAWFPAAPTARGAGTRRLVPAAARARASRPSASASSSGRASRVLVLANRRPPENGSGRGAGPPEGSTERHQALWIQPPPTGRLFTGRTPRFLASQSARSSPGSAPEDPGMPMALGTWLTPSKHPAGSGPEQAEAQLPASSGAAGSAWRIRTPQPQPR